MKSLLIIIFITGLSLAQTRPAMIKFTDAIKVDKTKYVLWYSYEIDSVWLNVNLPDGNLPRRENRTYRYWKADAKGKLQPITKIYFKPEITKDETVLLNKETLFINQEDMQ